MTSRPRGVRPRAASVLPAALTVLALSTVAIVGLMASAAEARDFSAIIREESVAFTVSGGKGEETVHRKIEVLSQGGREYGRIVLGETDFSDIVRFEANIYGPDGALRQTYGKKDALRVCGFSGYALYSDLCMRVLSLTSDAYPYTIDYTYTVKYGSLFFWPDFRPQQQVPVESSVYTLTAPKGFAFHTRITGGVPPPDTAESGKTITYIYRMSNIPAIEAEDYAYSPGDVMAGVSFSPAAYTLDKYSFKGEEWPHLGKDGFELFRQALTVDEAQKKLVDSIAAAGDSPRELLRRLHHALMRRMRYVAVEVGIGGWRPHPAPETFACAYGDCKDLTILETSLLTYAGIEAHPVLLGIYTEESISPDFPSLSGFNHVILFSVIDGDTIWLDPTCTYCEAGDLPAADEDRYVLVVDSTAGRLIRTPASRPEDNLISRTAEIQINPDRSMSVRLTLSGAGNVRHAFLSEYDAIDKRELNRMVDLFGPSDNLIIDSARCVVCDPDSTRVTMAAFGRVANAVLSAADRQYVDVDFLAPLRNREKMKLEDRKLAINLSYPLVFVDTFIISPPAGVTAGALSDTLFSGEFGTLRQQVWSEAGRIYLVRYRESYPYSIAPDQIASFGQYRDELSRRIAHRLVLSKP